jgi:hypothetical protein
MAIDIRDAQELLTFTEGSREDFHEPDEQGIELIGLVGTKLDNAYGNSIDAKYIADGFQEAIVLLRKDTGKPGLGHYKNLVINLATLIALARIGAKQLTRYKID